MLFHYVTDVPLPTLEKDDSADEMVVYATLSEYLSLPKTMRELINHQDTFDLVHRYSIVVYFLLFIQSTFTDLLKDSNKEFDQYEGTNLLT